MNSKEYPLVSILIVNWNGGDVFKDCLKSLQKVTYRNWELIVVDNGSSDGSEKFPEKYKLPITNYHLLKNSSNLGFAPANNQGLLKAKGKYILLLNNDTKVTPQFLTLLVNRINNDDTIGVIQPKIYMMSKKGYLDNAGSFMTRIGFLSHWGFGEKDGNEFAVEREVFSAKGACILIDREVIESVELFDNDFNSYFEESDFCWRVWLAGWKVLFYPSATIEHKVGFTIQRLDITQINFDYYKNRIMSLIKNFGTVNLLTILPVHIVVSVGIAFVFFVRGQKKSSLMIINAICWNIKNIKNTMRKRRKIQKARTIDDKTLFNELMAKIDFLKFFGDFKRVEKDMK